MALDKITHVHYAFFDVDSSCSVRSLDTYADYEKRFNVGGATAVGALQAFRMLRAQHPHLVLAYSLGGWTKSRNFSPCARDPALRAKLVQESVELLTAIDFDGIDVDWEYPVCCGVGSNQVGPDDWANYLALLTELRAALDAASPGVHKELTIAMGMSPSVTGVAPMAELAGVLDAVNLMTYDYNGGWLDYTAHNAPLRADPAYEAAGGDARFNIEWGVREWLKEVPGSKLVMGLPAYGRSWTQVTGGEYLPAIGPAPEDSGRGTASGATWEKGVVSWWDLEANYLGKTGWTRGFNAVSEVPYLTSSSASSSSGYPVFVSYDDESSIAAKAAFARELGLAGMMWWEASDDKGAKLKTTAGSDCDVESDTARCWEPSEQYFWADLLEALRKMSLTGVGGRTFYAGATADDYVYGLANLAAFLSQTMQETIQYDACDENNWSDAAATRITEIAGGTPGEVYPATAACGQLGQSYQDYTCGAEPILDPETGEEVPAAEVQCEVDPDMVAIAQTGAGWYGAPPPLFCAPRSIIAEAPRWDPIAGWCPPTSRSQFYGPSTSTASVPAAVLDKFPTYLDYVKNSIDKIPNEGCASQGGCCMDVDNHRAGAWKSCPGGCKNDAKPDLVVGREARTDVEGCCWWGRGVIQTTGVCNFGKLNYFAGKRAADRGRSALYPTVDFCRDPGAICRSEFSDLRWVAGFFYWLNDVQPYSARGRSYMDVLSTWVDAGANPADTTLVDMASGIVNRGCHDAPFDHGLTNPLSTTPGVDPCGNGEVHAADKRRKNFAYIWQVLQAALPSRVGRRLESELDRRVIVEELNEPDEQVQLMAEEPRRKQKLSAGEIAAVIIAIVIVGIAIGAGFAFKVRQKRARATRASITEKKSERVSLTEAMAQAI